MKTIQEDSEISTSLPEALEVYREAWSIFTKTEILIEETDAQDYWKHYLDGRVHFDYMHCIMMCLDWNYLKTKKVPVILTSSGLYI